jgi:hypothetical protein
MDFENDIIDNEDELRYDNSGEFEGVNEDDFVPEGLEDDFDYIDDYDNADDDGEFEGVSEDDYVDNDLLLSDFDYDDIDFSNLAGKDFKGSFKKVNRKVEQKQQEKIKRVSVPVGRPVIVEGKKKELIRRPNPQSVVRKKTLAQRPVADKKSVTQRPIVQRKKEQLAQRQITQRAKPLSKEIGVKKGARLVGGQKKISRVIVPRDKKVIVEGVSKFILSKDTKDDALKQIGYYKGKKLKELVLIFNNNSPLDFNLELFNPSMPLDYLYNTSLNLNDKISVANSPISYSDVLFNLLANPTMIVNAVFTFAGPSVNSQISQSLQFTNKEITGTQLIHPINLNLQLDIMQVFGYVVNFEIMKTLERPFIPDGMDVIKYKVLAGMTVTMGFYYRQKSLKKFFYKEARDSKGLM